MLYESIKHGAKAVTPSVNSTFFCADLRIIIVKIVIIIIIIIITTTTVVSKRRHFHCCSMALYNKQRSLDCALFCCEAVWKRFFGAVDRKLREETRDYVSCSLLHFFRALATSCVVYYRTEHIQGFFICSIRKVTCKGFRVQKQ